MSKSIVPGFWDGILFTLPRLSLLLGIFLLSTLVTVPASAQTTPYQLQLSTSPARTNPVPLTNQTVSGSIYVFTSPDTNVTKVEFFLDDAGMARAPIKTENITPFDFAGTATATTAFPFATTRLANGAHTITAAVTVSTGTRQVVIASFTVNNGSTPTPTSSPTPTPTCSPLPCNQIKIVAPYQLNFSQDHGKIKDKNNIGTGFTYIDKPTSGTGYLPANLTMDTAAGVFKITTTKGIQFTTANSQDNALAVGIDAPSQISQINTTLMNIPQGTGQYQQAGLWFGNDQNNYVKLNIISVSTTTYQIQYVFESGGVKVSEFNTAPLSLAGAKVALRLRANPADRTIAATYSINGGAFQSASSVTAPGEFFSFDAAGINPEIGTRSFAGIYATHRNGPSPLQYTFDDFSVIKEGPVVPPPSTDLSFTRSSFPVNSPTSMVWGPDGKLYVTELLGKIHQVTLNATKQFVSEQVITTLGSRLTLGITVDPASTPSNVILWVSHSSPSLDNGEPNSSMVTKLSGTNFATRTDVITGLPRAKANHAINAIHFGPDNKLYIALGGNTGAGAPNTANTEFGTMQEQPLSAALLVADVFNQSFDGTCANTADIFGPAPCSVTPYATGLRNTYDFIFHSNGSIYAPDNGLGVTGTYPPSPTAPCFGNGSTTSYTQGGHNPGSQPDILNRIEQGKYYGHPNPYRSECVFKDGHFQGVSPLPNYVLPTAIIGNSTSTNGIIEYTSDKFCGALKGELLMANYSVGDNLVRYKLAADGKSVVAKSVVADGFMDPLPVTQSPDGTIFVGELAGNKVTALVPNDTGAGCWTSKAAMPQPRLDAGGAAVSGKFYVVSGKTSTGYFPSLFIYDPTTNIWTTGSNHPGVGLENPAVVSFNNLFYMFGGATAPFSGAVTTVAMYNPATNQWSSLAPMGTARSGATAQVINGKMYIVGGMDPTGASLATGLVYDPATNTWSMIASMATRRDNPGSFVAANKLYVFGGRTRNSDGTTINGTLNTTEMYDPTTNTWVAKAAMPTGRRAMAVGAVNGKAQVMGGEITASGGVFSQNEEYDPTTNVWKTLIPMKTPRHGTAFATVNGAVYVAGGGITGGSSFSTILEAFSF